ncbi:hypothetical protein K2173_021159 [Erythroxylum novogranatense]|uniref:Protein TRIGALACTOSYLDIACYLGLYCEROL 4, chloroplastic n=1 Tax=Erythroxylum novogranatense TaxID=1862640 RepID=A0AAV8TPZ9_9ROSI|nr:hypothetical protein K2173_021159 [Erythroxylum novogranatense]
MKKLRWVMDGESWELDTSTPRTLEGEARAVPGEPLPLGISRGTKLSRPRQLDFFQRFMAVPFLVSFSSPSHGFSLQRVLTLPSTSNWFATFLGQFNLQKFVSSLKHDEDSQSSSALHRMGRHLLDKSLYALGFCSELLLTPDDTLLFSLDTYGHSRKSRKKAVFHHKFPCHNFTAEAAWPALFVDDLGNYWDVPVSFAMDLASVGVSESGFSYHLCMQHNEGLPKPFEADQSSQVPAALLPGTSMKGAFSFKKDVEFWRSKAQKLKMVQPFDMFLSNPHISASGIIGAALRACIGENSTRLQVEDDTQGSKGLFLHAPVVKSSLLADLFASATFTAQYGNFQRLFLDLTRFHARLDFPSGSKCLLGAHQLALDLLNSQQPNLGAVNAICPNVTISLQQQIAGPFSFRVDSGVALDWKNKDWNVEVDVKEPVFAVEYALHVLGSAKAIAWYSPKHQEFMVELRFYET